MSAPQKPHDVGNGLVCASFGAQGEWLSMATVDPEFGFVELIGLPLFDPELRGNEVAVHRYRSWMRREEHAFIHVEAGRASVTTRQDAPKASRGLVQRLTFRAPRQDRPAGIRIRFSGRVGPPALAQIPEPNAPTADVVDTVIAEREGTLLVSGAGPPVVVQAWLRRGEDGSTSVRADKRIPWKPMRRRMPTAIAWIDWPDGAEEVHVDIACTFDRPAPERPEWLSAAGPIPVGRDARDTERPLKVPTRMVRPLGRLNQRATSYVRTCTALQVSGSERTILADHRILPLSWNRDAYWQARLLLATWSRGEHDDDVRIVADHLRWLFLRCERPDGRWLGSHHADGRRNDHRFQADQQLYPLAELADYLATTGTLPELPAETSWNRLVADAWSAVEGAIDVSLGLIRTELSPRVGEGSEVAEGSEVGKGSHPFLISDQVLLWRVATQLAALAPKLDLAKGPFATRASEVRAAVKEHFEIDGALGPMWAYSVDGSGGAERYMAATDLPVFLAALWGFCKSSDRRYQATMRFAFDPANPGFVPGVAGGLGAADTPGTWTLGDIARWVSAGLAGNQDAAEGALQRLLDVAFSDGMLPEAYDPEGSGSVVRHWFAWPGAVLGVLLLDHAARSTGD